MAKQYDFDTLSKELEASLTCSYGPLLGSHELWKALGYKSPAAFRQARNRKTLPIDEFEIPGRRGRFALTQDVARWLAEQRMSIS